MTTLSNPSRMETVAMENRSPRPGRRGRLLGAALGALALAACDLEVSNPGPVQDTYLNDKAAFQAQVNGMALALSKAMNYLVYHGGIVTREIFPTGMAGQFGVEPRNMNGYLIPDEQGSPWSESQQARWLAERGLQRFREVLPAAEFDASAQAAQASLWAGYANRLLGENMCLAVIDGGAPQPSVEYLKRAEDHFTRAIQIGTAAKKPEIATAATAARAAVRVHRGNWEGALADAAAVPTSFVYRMQYFDIGDEYQYNRTAWASMSRPYTGHTVWNTVYEKYFESTQDKRTPFNRTNQLGSGAVEGIGRVNWWPQIKYADKVSPINLSTGREMRLIEAEAKLRGGDWQRAMQIVNQLRADVGAPAVAAADATEAWARLKRERGIELWLEARRLGDMRRWKEDNVPGALDPLEVPGAASYLKGQDLCFPLSQAEIDTNPNVPKG
jgi:hypothetical protein